MFSLQPYEYFTLFIQLDDHTDTERDNYYVQTVIRNARTSELITAVNLDSKGDGEYSKPWQVPADPTGLGLYIKVVTTVYEDAEHTTKVSRYGQEGEVYLIADRVQPHSGGGSIDYKKIKTLIDEAIGEIKIPEYQVPVLDLSPILGEISRLYNALNEFPRYKDSTKELNDIRGAISSLLPMLKALDKPEKVLDLSPITEKIEELSRITTEAEKSLTSGHSSIESSIESAKEEISESLDEIKNVRMNFRIVSEPKEDILKNEEEKKKKITRARY